MTRWQMALENGVTSEALQMVVAAQVPTVTYLVSYLVLGCEQHEWTGGTAT